MFFRRLRTKDVFGANRRLVFELLIVFLGVYAAFWVDTHREELAERERSRDVAQAIQRGLEDVIEAESGFIEDSLAGLSDWRSARERVVARHAS